MITEGQEILFYITCGVCAVVGLYIGLKIGDWLFKERK